MGKFNKMFDLALRNGASALPEKLSIPADRLPIAELWYLYLAAKELRDEASAQRVLAYLGQRLKELVEKGTITL